MIAKIICWWKGHKRGRRIGGASGTDGRPFADFECPRCGSRWTRKERKA